MLNVNSFSSYNVNDLKLLHINIRSIRRNLDSLILFLTCKRERFDILILSEIWIYENEVNKYQIPGYKCIIQERGHNASGGVAIYVQDEFKFNYKLYSFPEAEAVKVTLFLPLHDRIIEIDIVGIYRNCNFSFYNFSNNFTTILNECNKTTILTGDLNMCLLDQNNTLVDYLSILSSRGFVSLMNEPTWERDNLSKCLDHVFIRDNKYLNCKCKLENVDFSDHALIYIECELQVATSLRDKFIKSVDYSLLGRRLAGENWRPVFDCYCPDEALKAFYNVYNNCLEQSSYIKQINSKNRHRNPWISNSLIKKINEKNNCFVKFKKSKNNQDKEIYLRLSKECSRLIKKEKINYYSKKIDLAKGNSKLYWNVVKSILKKNKSELKEIRIDSKIIRVDGNEKEIANAFNNHFTGMPARLIRESFGQDLFPRTALPRLDLDFN